jgi:hypothetical protein
MAVIPYKGAVIWMAQRQKSTALSSIKAEIIIEDNNYIRGNCRAAL